MNKEKTSFQIATSKKGIFLAWCIIFIFIIYFLVTWYNIIFDPDKIPNVRIVGDITYTVVLPLQIFTLILLIYAFIRLITGFFGDLLIQIENNHIKISYQLSLFKFSNNYKLESIHDLRIVDKGKNNFIVAFNYSDKLKMVRIGLKYSKEISNDLYNFLIGKINKERPHDTR